MKVELKFQVAAADRSIEAAVQLPDEPVRPAELLPVVLALTDAVVGMSESRVTENGEAISCRAGCGACCRQLVPVSEPEALHLAGVVGAMGEERRARVAERFRQARDKAGPVLEGLHASSGDAAVAEMGKAAGPYFALGIPCPFLEQESCSIHAQRPAICREYLVTSPAEHCARMDPERVKRVTVPVTVSSTLMYFSDGRGTEDPRVMPLIDALDFAARLGEQAEAVIPAPEMFRNFMKQFLGEERKGAG